MAVNGDTALRSINVSDKKPSIGAREWWILHDNKAMGDSVHETEKVAQDRKLRDDKLTHVIEYSAYTDLLREVKALRDGLRMSGED